MNCKHGIEIGTITEPIKADWGEVIICGCCKNVFRTHIPFVAFDNFGRAQVCLSCTEYSIPRYKSGTTLI